MLSLTPPESAKVKLSDPEPTGNLAVHQTFC
jgi:hypothetical protein